MYRFESQVAQKLYDDTAAHWRALIAADPDNMSSSYYEARLQHCAAAINGETFGNGRGGLCAVVDGPDRPASAFVIVTYAVNKHLKMLDVYVAPDLNAANREPDTAALAWIAATAIIGCLDMTYRQYPCNELKMLAGWPLDHDFLTAITTAMMSSPNFGALFEVTSHGNWIVLRKRPATKQ